MKNKDCNKQKKDIFGLAISAYYNTGDETDIIVHSPDFDDDVIPVKYLFRDYKEMPPLERKALNLAQGKVLDVGCGAGSHALYLQKEKKLQVTAIDISKGAVDVARARGIEDARVLNFFDFQGEKFDTILLLMNGTGIIGNLQNMDKFFEHVRTLLNPQGQVIIDSSDLSYLFDADEDGGIWIEKDAPYYGELEFSLSYKEDTSSTFSWLYLDFNNMELAAAKNGFSCNLIKKGKHFDYLAILKPLKS